MIPKYLSKHRTNLLVLCTAIGLAFLIALLMTFSPGSALAQTPNEDSISAPENVVYIYLPVVGLNASGNIASKDALVVTVADLQIVSFDVVDPPSEVLVGETVTITLRKVIDNNGPSAPMDTELTMGGIAPPDSVITPTMKVFPEYALGLEENRVVTETFMIKCGGASNHVFTFTNQIMPLDLADSDPDLSNNSASLDLPVECIVPVQLNIKPGSFPNSINTKSEGVIPVAILTTMAGEYGLPLDFDATLIDPLSVRFGPPELVWDESGGAFEAHNRGHIEDSYEMDEMTKDGDLDLVLHFRTQETGIDLYTTQACAKGEWTDDMGNIHKFYGCDLVRIVPGASK